MMQVEVGRFEFAERIREFDSCDLTIRECDALFDWVEDMIDQGILDANVCVGDWAISTCAYLLEELQSEHPDKYLISWESVQANIDYDFLDNSFSDCIVVDDNTAVMVSL